MDGKNSIKSKGKLSTLQEAQTLYSVYHTLQTNTVLEEFLYKTVDNNCIDGLSDLSINQIYNKIILQYYPNEISVKSSFINEVLLKSKNHVTIFELPVGNSRADLCKINGSSIAYEIKTDLDNLLRLNKQLEDYSHIFEKSFVICTQNKLQAIKKQIPESCGIYTYTISNRGKYKFNLYRPASQSQNLNSLKQLEILQKKELINNFNIDKLNNRNELITLIMQKYSNAKINEVFKETIKARYYKQWEFLRNNHSTILEIDYQWFFKNSISPELIYN